MGRICHSTHSELYERIALNNLRRQFEVIRDMTSVGLVLKGFRVNKHIICSLHSSACLHLVDSPGGYRDDDAHLVGSGHIPPPPSDLINSMSEYFVSIHEKWDTEDTFLLAAYVLWRLLWIHPFEDGNGRTARAAAYLTLCLKYGRWLPGKNTLLQRIKENSSEFEKTLHVADKTEKNGAVDLTPLALLLARLVQAQLLEALAEAGVDSL